MAPVRYLVQDAAYGVGEPPRVPVPPQRDLEEPEGGPDDLLASRPLGPGRAQVAPAGADDERPDAGGGSGTGSGSGPVGRQRRQPLVVVVVAAEHEVDA